MNQLKFKLCKKIKLSVGLLALGLVSQAQACESEPYIGSICYTAANYCPREYLQANGATLSISAHTALFSLLGTNYGGNGQTTFMLPDLRGRSAIGSGQGVGLSVTELGEKSGSESVTLTVDNLAPHSHAFVPGTPGGAPTTLPVTIDAKLYASNLSSDNSKPSDGSYLATVTTSGSGAQKIWTSTVPLGSAKVAIGGLEVSGKATLPAGTGVTGTVQPAGKGTPVNTRSPALAMTACIAAQGLYPSRN